MPHWLVAAPLFAAATPGLYALGKARRARRRAAAGLCASCGYDMRESPGRCPECGVRVGTAT